MNDQWKDPFEAAAYEEEEEEESPPADSPLIAPDDDDLDDRPSSLSSGAPAAPDGETSTADVEDEDDEDEEKMEVELAKLPSRADKNHKMHAILSQFTEGQMRRYECFRRSSLQKSTMRRLLGSITGKQQITLPVLIVVRGMAKMFVGELVETARIVMTERMESGPIRPCHIRESYRRLKLQGKVPKRSVPRLFR